ncbi:MAG: pyruvate dehydrogenase (acetyl-transferring) E1 component subunit alpha [Candidatus Dormiibacterota bacterium]
MASTPGSRRVRPKPTATRSGEAELPLGLTPAQCRHMYRQLVQIRRFEEHAAEAYAQAKVGGFLHLYIGEEAVAVGALNAARDTDHVLAHYRDHGYALARGCDPKACMAELFGREDGLCHGRGGSMHLAEAARHFWGGHAIVGSHIPIGAGMAYAMQYQQSDEIVLDFFGDGATGNGIFHEGLNMAALWNLPIIFICENNLYGMGATLAEESPVSEMMIKAEGYTMPAVQCDGMEVLSVYEAVQKAAEHCRSGQGPFFVEALTYRFRGHSMADPELYRAKAEVQRWRTKDPIPRFGDFCVKHGICTPKELAQVNEEVEQEMLDAVAFADKSPWPEAADVARWIYAKPIDPEADGGPAAVALEVAAVEPQPEVSEAGI